NGANTSFVNRIVDEKAPIEELIGDPVARTRKLPAKPHPRIPLPVDLFGGGRRNSAGIDLTDPEGRGPLAQAMDTAPAGGAGASRRSSAASAAAARRSP